MREKRPLIFYFYPAECKKDLIEYERVNQYDNIYCLAFKNSHHAVTFTGSDYKHILCMKEECLNYLINKCQGKMVNRISAFYLTANAFSATVGLSRFLLHKLRYGEGLGIR